MRPHGADHRRQKRLPALNFRDDMAELPRLPGDGGRGIDDDDPVGVAPHGKVGAAVAGIVEPLASVAAHELPALFLALEVAHAVGGDNVVEQPEMIGDGSRRLLVRCGREHDRAPIALLLAQELDQLGVVGQRLRCQLSERANLLLEARAAHRQQSRQLAKCIAARDERQHAFDSGVRTQQRTVQIDAEGLGDAGGLPV